MIRRDISDGISIQGHLTVRSYDVETIRGEYPGWDSMDDEERLSALESIEPDEKSQTSNLVLDSYLTDLAIAIANNSMENVDITHLAVGNGTTAPASTNTTLNNEVYRTKIGTRESDAGDVLTSTLFGQTEANGYTLTECGLTGSKVTDQDVHTHAVFDSADQIDKNSGMVVVIDYILQLQ